MPPDPENIHSKIGILLPRVPQYYETIRSGHRGTTDLWRRLFRSKPRFIGQHEAVRGLPIASEHLLHSVMLSNPFPTFEYHLFCGLPPALFSQWLDAKAAPPLSRFRIRDAASLAERGSLRDIQLWYEPQANYGAVYQVRDRFAERAYPIVSTVHGVSIHSGLFDQFARVLLSDTSPNDSFVCSSAASKVALERLIESISDTLERRYHIKRRFAGRYDVIPLPIDIGAIRPHEKAAARRGLRLPADCTLLLYFGLISPLKADLFPCLLALSEFSSDLERYNLIFSIAGGGDDRYVRALMEFARAVGFPTSRLRIFADPTDQVKNMLFAAADVFTSPADSVQEAFGLTVIEAMAHGVPQVVADWSGYRDTVQDGVTGFLVPTLWTRCDEGLRDTGFLLGWTHDHHLLGQSVAMDIEYWRKSVLMLLNDIELRNRMSEASRKRAALFSMDRVRQQYLDLWSDLLTQPLLPRNPCDTLQIERPRYYDWFQHFASKQVSPNVVLEAVRRPHRRLIADSANGVKPCVRVEVLDSIFRAADAHESLTLGAVTKILSETVAPPIVIWHVMWALKHGLLRVKEVNQ